MFGVLRDFPKPVSTALNGVAMADDLELTMLANIVIAAESDDCDAHADFSILLAQGGGNTTTTDPAEDGNVYVAYRQVLVGQPK